MVAYKAVKPVVIMWYHLLQGFVSNTDLEMPYFSNHPPPTPPLNLPLPSNCKAEQEKQIKAGVLGKRKLERGFSERLAKRLFV